ncbi:hypothetical protein CROQUDRAFT_94867 [Cronartium quercuum f. sp. fusiforme G11]|uniref:Uncharacterized protein n=1 Tax=Cronartium quercuum f. sp. fusiforme G11 TaxID=708437 RepID=A0A9P6T9X9_9BASI|nr:hypothetical protein CROQUDRAFT_94867 [Cronartium quercuum f. sp. fusiforme G11]
MDRRFCTIRWCSPSIPSVLNLLHHPTRRLLEELLKRFLKRHRSPIHSLFKRGGLLEEQRYFVFPSAPWIGPHSVIKKLNSNQEEARKVVPEQVHQENETGAIVMFTHGSFLEGRGGGAAYATKNETFRVSLGPSLGSSNYKIKAMGLLPALKNFNPLYLEQYSSLALFYDSQAVPQLLNDPTRQSTAQYLAAELHTTLAAKLGAEEQTENTELKHSLSNFMEIGKKAAPRKGSPSCPPSLINGTTIADRYDKLEKEQAASFFQLRSGHKVFETKKIVQGSITEKLSPKLDFHHVAKIIDTAVSF